MLRTCTVSVARAARAFATAKGKPFLSDAIAKAAIGKDAEVATSFVSAFAAVVHRKRVRVTDVCPLPETTGLSLAHDMKHDIALRYSVGGAEAAVMAVVPQHYNRALVEILQPETYLPGRALAHASGHYLAAIDGEAKAVKAEKRKAMEEDKRAATEGGAACRKSPSKGPRAVFDSAVYTAYVRVEPVHLLVLSDFCYAYDTTAKVWRAPKSSSVLAGGKYGWASPLFSTFRLTTDAGSARQFAGVDDPGPNTFASSLRDRLSITTIHLPMVPSVLDDKDAWSKVVTLPEHQEALESAELRQWLHYLAHTSLKDGKVEMPVELRAYPIFRKSAEMAEAFLRTSAFGYFKGYSEKQVAAFFIRANRDKEDARKEILEEARKERAEDARKVWAAAAEALKKESAAAAAAAAEERAAAAKERAAAAEALKKECAAAAEARAVAAEALEKEQAAAAAERAAAAEALEKERALAAKREAVLLSELKLLKKPGTGVI